MSRYKTPFPTEVESSKALQVRTSKYKLPFKKDEPVEELHVTLHNLSQQNITLNSEVRLPKLAVSTDLQKANPLRKHRNNHGGHQQINNAFKSEKQSLNESYLDAGTHYRPLKTEPNEPKISQRDKLSSQREKQEAPTRPKLSIHAKRKRRFLSSASKYADDEGPSIDAIEQSDQEVIFNKKQGKIIQSQLPVIGENRTRGEHEDSDEDIKIWQDLSKDIERYQEKKQKQELLKRKIKLKHKNRKSLKRQHQADMPFSLFQNQLKKNSQKSKIRSQSIAGNDAFYSLAKLQSQQSRKRLKSVQPKDSSSMIDKMKDIIAVRNEKIVKGKSRLPIDFYVNSYEQIKSINPFFRKLGQMEGCIMLNVGKLLMLEPSKSVYSQGDPSKELYIIIYGKVLLTNKFKTLKKFALTGETLGEDELFQNEKSYTQRLKEPPRHAIHKYDAKALSKTCLLRVQLRRYYKMSCELNRMGYKQQFKLIDNLFRINYLNKQTNLHYNERDRVQTDASGSNRSHPKHGLYFF